jgi:hypothetical protein
MIFTISAVSGDWASAGVAAMAIAEALAARNPNPIFRIVQSPQ